MTENIGRVITFPLANQLCTAIRAAVDKLGGDEFFDKLEDNAVAFDEEFSKESLRPILARCLGDSTFRTRVLVQVSTDQNREFLSRFLDAWDLWKELFPSDHEWITLALSGPPLKELFGPIPFRTNAFFRCISELQLDSYFEDLRVKSSIQLAYANKQLGGDGTLILSGSVSNFLESLRIALNSLILEKDEASLFKIAKDSEIVSNITEELGHIKTIADVLLKQFEGMIVSSRRALSGSGSRHVPPGDEPPSE
jgi:hypothetical protein